MRSRPLLTLLLTLAASTPLAAQTIDFESVASGTTTPPPLSVTVGGLTATFSTPICLCPSGGVVSAPPTLPDIAPGSPLFSGQRFYSFLEGPGPTANLVEIGLGAPATALSLSVGAFTSGFTLSAYNGATLVGSTSITGTLFSAGPTATLPTWAGTLTFVAAGGFTSVQVGTTTPTTIGLSDTFLMIDNVTVRGVSAVPEPTSLLLVATGAIGVGLAAWRRRVG